MSCYIVNDKTINVILTELFKCSSKLDREITERMFKRMNISSYNARYNEASIDKIYLTFKEEKEYTQEMLKGAIKCYMYQSVESPYWEESRVNMLCRLLLIQIGDIDSGDNWEVH